MIKSIIKWELNKRKDEVKKILLNSREFKKEYETSWARVDYLMADINSIYIFSNESEIQLSENGGVGSTSIICIIMIKDIDTSRSILEANFKVGVFSFNFFLLVFFILLFISLILLFFDITLSFIFFFIALFFLLFLFTKYLVIKKILKKLRVSMEKMIIDESY